MPIAQTRIESPSVTTTTVQSASWNLKMGLKIRSTAKRHAEITFITSASSNGPQVDDDLLLQSLAPSVAATGLQVKRTWSRKSKEVSRRVKVT